VELGILSRFRNDAERVLEGEAVDNCAEVVFGVDPVAKVDNPVTQVPGENIPRGCHHLLADGLEVIQLDAFRVQQLIGAIPQVHEIPGH